MNSRSNVNHRKGFTLLEVLVACGILVIALASVAAILPAAASRLGDATAIERANTQMAIAMSEIQTRGLATRNIFPSLTESAAVVIGESLPSAVLTSVTNSGYAGVSLLPTASGSANNTSFFRNGTAILRFPTLQR